MLSKVLISLRNVKLNNGGDDAGSSSSDGSGNHDGTKTEKDTSRQHRILVDKIRGSTKFLLMTVEQKDLRGNADTSIAPQQAISSKND